MNRETLELGLNELNNRERNILELRLGILNGLKYNRSQKEVADMLGISQSYIDRLEKKIQTKWKQLGMSESEILELFATSDRSETTIERPEVRYDTQNVKLDKEFIASYLINLSPRAREIVEKYILRDETEMSMRERRYYNINALEDLIREENIWNNTLKSIEKWLDRSDVNTEKNTDECIDIFCKLTDATNPTGRRILGKEFLSIDYRIINEREEKRKIGLIVAYINKVFNGVPREIVVNIIKE